MEGEEGEEPSEHALARTVGPLAALYHSAPLGTEEGNPNPPPPQHEYWRNPGFGDDIIPR